MIEPTLATVAGTASQQLARRVIGRLADKLMGSAENLTKALVDQVIVSFHKGFATYLETSYNKCRFFKSIINPNEPLEVMQNYVHVTLTCGTNNISDEQLIEEIDKFKSAVVTGLAGGGKSMLMRYLTVWSFEHKIDRIPLFVELRHLNSLSSTDLVTFVRNACTSKLSVITEDQFNLALKHDAFLLILDGFDELNHDIREEIQRHILAIRKDFPKTSIIISSRIDERFNSWTEFHVFRVDALTKDKTIELIQNLPYDSHVKQRFVGRVDRGLYESHKSFLSSPLLATIMLLTFEAFADIPHTMHTFYSQAFDTLFQKHDALKEQYQRQTHTGLPLDEFKACFAAFCALSYLNQKYSFTDEALQKTARDALSYMKPSKSKLEGRGSISRAAKTSRGRAAGEITPKQMIDDLTESVCMLQPDGIEVSFVHRSFQEYFAARFVTSLPANKIAKIVDKFSLRPEDSVIPMIYDMYRDPLEQEWILPMLEKLDTVCARGEIPGQTTSAIAQFWQQLAFARRRNAIVLVTGIFGELSPVYRTLYKLFPKDLGMAPVIDKLDIGEIHLLGKTYREAFSKLRPGEIMVVNVDIDHEWFFDHKGIRDGFRELRARLGTIRKRIGKRSRARDTILSEFI